MEQLYLDVLIADDIRSKIENKVYPEYARLPSEQQLCEAYRVQKMTIRSSLQILKDEGVIFSVHRSGYYVKPARIKKDIRSFQSTADLLHGLGKECESQVLRLDLQQADQDLAKRAGIEPGTWLYFMERLRIVEGATVAIEQNYILADLFPGLMKDELELIPLHQLLSQRYHVQMERSEMEITVVYAEEHEAQLLPVSLKEPLIKESGRIYDEIGRIIEYTDRFLMMDRFQFIG